MANKSVAEIEEWRPVPGRPDYEASSLGRVRSLDRWVKSEWKGQPIRRFCKGILLRPTPGRRYEQVYLGKATGYRGRHSIICLTFQGKRPSKRHQVGHINGNPHDNRARNLRWVTPKQNKADEIRHGTRRNGSSHWHANLTEDTVIAIRKMHAESGLSMSAVGKRFGISRFHAWQVISRNSWKHLP